MGRPAVLAFLYLRVVKKGRTESKAGGSGHPPSPGAQCTHGPPPRTDVTWLFLKPTEGVGERTGRVQQWHQGPALSWDPQW